MAGTVRLIHGDCLEQMASLPSGSVDAIITDPPYGLRFMGKRWDYDVPAVDVWCEALRVLKPGGHLLSFGGSRTYHRMACAIEDAGFEIRDQIMWIYGSGFPKSHDVSKAIDKTAGVKREVVGTRKRNGGPAGMTSDKGWHSGPMLTDDATVEMTEPATVAAQEWDGWGTALKPAHEPICMARKPFAGTVAANVLEHGTGAVNVDACRVGAYVNTTPTGQDRYNASNEAHGFRPGAYAKGKKVPLGKKGRWPANLVLDEEAGAVLDRQSGPAGGSGPASGPTHRTWGNHGIYGGAKGDGKDACFHGKESGASRFFYCAKASRYDRNEGLEDPGPQFQHGTTLRKIENAEKTGNTHPTVKPTLLMRWLCRLVTPIGGTVLDPFMGSGTTGKAAILEGFSFVGIELEEESFCTASRRIAAAEAQTMLSLEA